MVLQIPSWNLLILKRINNLFDIEMATWFIPDIRSRIEELQLALGAEERRSLLVVLQGRDTAFGKVADQSSLDVLKALSVRDPQASAGLDAGTRIDSITIKES